MYQLPAMMFDLAFVRTTVKIVVSRFKWAKLTAVNFVATENEAPGLRSQAYATIACLFFFLLLMMMDKNVSVLQQYNCMTTHVYLSYE